MKNQTLSLLILIFIFSACSPKITEYLPMKDEVNGVSYVMGLEMRRSNVKITGIDPREGGVMQKLKYTVTSSNVDRNGALNYVNRIIQGDSLVDNDTKKTISTVMHYHSTQLGSLMVQNPCIGQTLINKQRLLWVPPVIFLKLDDNNKLARRADGGAFIPNGLYSKMVVGPDGNRFRTNYDFSGSFLTITHEFILD